MSGVVGDTPGLDLSHEGADHLVVLVMDAGNQSALADGAKAGVENMWRDARKPLRMRTEGRELESGGAGVDQFIDPCCALVRIDRRIQREIDPRLRAGFADLGAETLRGGDQAIVIVRHVDDGGDAAGRGAARRPDEVFLAELAAAVHLGVDGAGKHQKIRTAVLFTGGDGAGPDRLDQSVTCQNVSIFDDPIRKDDGAPKDLVSHCCLCVAGKSRREMTAGLRHPNVRSSPNQPLTSIGRSCR